MSNDAENPENGDPQKGPGLASSSVETKATWYDVLLQHISVYGIAAGYCLSASLLSIINKWVVMNFPYPGALTVLQYFTSATGVFLCRRIKLIEHDSLDLLTMWHFLPAAFIFSLSLLSSQTVSSYSMPTLTPSSYFILQSQFLLQLEKPFTCTNRGHQ